MEIKPDINLECILWFFAITKQGFLGVKTRDCMASYRPDNNDKYTKVVKSIWRAAMEKVKSEMSSEKGLQQFPIL